MQPDLIFDFILSFGLIIVAFLLFHSSVPEILVSPKKRRLSAISTWTLAFAILLYGVALAGYVLQKNVTLVYSIGHLMLITHGLLKYFLSKKLNKGTASWGTTKQMREVEIEQQELEVEETAEQAVYDDKIQQQREKREAQQRETFGRGENVNKKEQETFGRPEADFGPQTTLRR